MNRPQLLVLLITTALAASLEVDPLPDFRFVKLRKACDVDATTLCENADVISVSSTPFEQLKELTHGQEAYPALNYGPPKDMCLWHAFFNNKIQNQECISQLQSRIDDVEKKLTPPHGNEEVSLLNIPVLSQKYGGHLYFVYYSNPIWLHILAFVTYAYACHAYLSQSKLGRCAHYLIYGALLLSSGLLAVSSPMVTFAAGTVLSVILHAISTKDTENDNDDSIDNEYRRMDDEGNMYVAVPLQVV